MRSSRRPGPRRRQGLWHRARAETPRPIDAGTLSPKRLEHRAKRTAPQLRVRVDGETPLTGRQHRHQETADGRTHPAVDVGVAAGRASDALDGPGPERSPAACSSTVAPTVRSAAAIASVSSATSGCSSVVRPMATPASSSARLVMLLEPGTRACPVRGPGSGSDPRQRRHPVSPARSAAACSLQRTSASRSPALRLSRILRREAIASSTASASRSWLAM